MKWKNYRVIQYIMGFLLVTNLISVAEVARVKTGRVSAKDVALAEALAHPKPMININYVPDEVNFAHYHMVGTHNSHSYKHFFTTTYQHETDIADQLRNGVRGLAIDVY